MQKMLRLLAVLPLLFLIHGCVTQIENTYTINGDSNSIKATDTATATPTTSDVVDAAGTGSGSASANGGQ